MKAILPSPFMTYTNPSEQVYDHYANPPPASISGTPCPSNASADSCSGKRALGWRIAAFLKAPAAAPTVAVPVFLSTVTFILGCGLGWAAGKGPKRYGGYIK